MLKPDRSATSIAGVVSTRAEKRSAKLTPGRKIASVILSLAEHALLTNAGIIAVRAYTRKTNYSLKLLESPLRSEADKESPFTSQDVTRKGQNHKIWETHVIIKPTKATCFSTPLFPQIPYLLQFGFQRNPNHSPQFRIPERTEHRSRSNYLDQQRTVAAVGAPAQHSP